METQTWREILDLRCARGWDEDLRLGRRTYKDLLDAYEARTEASFEPGSDAYQARKAQAAAFRARLTPEGWIGGKQP